MATIGLPLGIQAGACEHVGKDDDAPSGRRGWPAMIPLEAGCHIRVSQNSHPRRGCPRIDQKGTQSLVYRSASVWPIGPAHWDSVQGPGREGRSQASVR